jgi:hypothetical protein
MRLPVCMAVEEDHRICGSVVHGDDALLMVASLTSHRGRKFGNRISTDKRPWRHAFPGTHLMLELWRDADFSFTYLDRDMEFVWTPSIWTK